MIKGTISNSSLITGVMSKEFSAIRCLDFNGSTDYVDVAHHSSLNPTNAISIECWINLTNKLNYNIMVVKGILGGKYQLNTVITSGVIHFRINDTSLGLAVGSIDVCDGNWHNIIGTYDINLTSNNIKIYVDVGLDGNKTYNTPIEIDTNPLLIGKRTDGYHFKNLIGIVRIYYNKALNATERQNNFNGKITQDGLVAEWLMRTQKGNTIYDTSINSNHGTIHDADWYEEKFNTPLKGVMTNSSEITGTMTAEYI